MQKITSTPSKRLHEKVSLITGAAQGIGLATAIKFAQEGAIVIVCDVKQTAVDEAVKKCQDIGAQALGFVMDVTQRDMVDATVKAVLEKFGRIDVLVTTTIIESGIDIPNANTLIVDRADLFGLSQLYQIRGRVESALRSVDPSVQLRRVEIVGPQVGSDLQRSARKWRHTYNEFDKCRCPQPRSEQ